VNIRHLYIFVFALFMISCGETNNTKTYATDNKSIIDYPTKGEGTFQSPYRVGSGIYQFNGEKYYNINVYKSECNVLVYGIKNFDSLTDLDLIDDSHSQERVPTYNYLYENLPKDGYDIIVSSNTYSTFGVFSTCIDEDSTQPNAYTEIEAGNRMSMEDEHALYKFTLSRVGKFILNTTSNDVHVRLYDEDMNSLYSESDNKHEKALESGDYYILLSKSNNNEDLDFVFDTSSL